MKININSYNYSRLHFSSLLNYSRLYRLYQLNFQKFEVPAPLKAAAMLRNSSASQTAQSHPITTSINQFQNNLTRNSIIPVTLRLNSPYPGTAALPLVPAALRWNSSCWVSLFRGLALIPAQVRQVRRQQPTALRLPLPS